MRTQYKVLWTATAVAVVAMLTPFPATAQTCNFDTYIDGSMCVGLDCTCGGGGFGFDTIVMKENNLRIKFQDTSNSASFPTRDWQIMANDSANGGLNRFSILDVDGGTTPFTIEGKANGGTGVPNNSLYLDSSGRLGLGTSNPATDIHAVSGNTPTLRLDQDSSSGFTPQTWDVAGNETNFFIRDVTTGSKLPFRIRPAAPTNSIFVDADGDVGIGTSSPAAPFEVKRSAGAGANLFQLTNDNSLTFRMDDTGDTGFWGINAQETSFRLFSIDDSNTPAIEFLVGSGGSVTIAGTLTTGGGGACDPGAGGAACDGVFAEDYELESIEEHAAFMWEHSYLPAVGSTGVNEPMNITFKTAGILNELEKAHIYIEQLHMKLEARDQRIDQLEESVRGLEELRALVSSLVEAGQ